MQLQAEKDSSMEKLSVVQTGAAKSYSEVKCPSWQQ